MMLNFHLHLILFLFQGGYVWLNVNSNDEFDVPIGVKILGTEGKNIRIQNDNGEVCVLHTVKVRYHNRLQAIAVLVPITGCGQI
jgi:hypothetical protein